MSPRRVTGGPRDRRNVVGWIGLCRLGLEFLDQDVDFGQLKARHRNVEVELEFHQVLEFDREDLAIPAGLLG